VTKTWDFNLLASNEIRKVSNHYFRQNSFSSKMPSNITNEAVTNRPSIGSSSSKPSMIKFLKFDVGFYPPLEHQDHLKAAMNLQSNSQILRSTWQKKLAWEKILVFRRTKPTAWSKPARRMGCCHGVFWQFCIPLTTSWFILERPRGFVWKKKCWTVQRACIGCSARCRRRKMDRTNTWINCNKTQDWKPL